MADSPLEQLAQVSGQEFKYLLEARNATAQKLASRRAMAGGLAIDGDASVVLMGSWGRGEVTSGSDDDYMVLVDGPWRPDHEVDPQIDEVAKILDIDPGREGLFGEIVFSDHLEKRIGLQEDDNNNLSRRMLLLLESHPLTGIESYESPWHKILSGYLRDAHKPKSPPRLLLNDIVRYWRTICVDFAGKQRKRRGEGWGIRNAKLRNSRKILFAGGLLPVLECAQLSLEEMGPFLEERLRLPPTDRLAQSFLDAGAYDAGARTLGSYDAFIGLLDDSVFRGSLESLTREHADDSPQFEEARRLGKAVQGGLRALLFETDTLPKVVQEYAIF